MSEEELDLKHFQRFLDQKGENIRQVLLHIAVGFFHAVTQASLISVFTDPYETLLTRKRQTFSYQRLA